MTPDSLRSLADEAAALAQGTDDDTLACHALRLAYEARALARLLERGAEDVPLNGYAG